jgi:molybdate transport system ATP-binding protein
VAAGESWAFVGSNGSGKSALARALAGELTLLSGQRESHFSRNPPLLRTAAEAGQR